MDENLIYFKYDAAWQRIVFKYKDERRFCTDSEDNGRASEILARHLADQNLSFESVCPGLSTLPYSKQLWDILLSISKSEEK